jgi:3-phenylpropionate/trans-cinnamate dioxygenase ferredoxin reductase subunit
MTSTDRFVIVGASLAGAKAAEALREQGFAGEVVLIGAESHHPYERPPLSKGYLAGSAERASVFVHPPEWYDEHRVELRMGTEVVALDPAARQVRLADGATVSYDKLLLTTGSSPRRLRLPGADASGIYYLRTLDDSEALAALFASAKRLAFIGGGWIGLEVAAAARHADVSVTVLETEQLPLLRVLGPELAEVFAGLHREHGVDFRFGVSVSEVTTHDGRATGVKLADGTVIEADAVLVAIGAVPNVSLAEEAGLRVQNGIVVDEGLRSSDPDIFAAGDVANAKHPVLGAQIRVEHWANALNQPAVAATSMLGNSGSYSDLPYFYTDQYDLGMEYVGYVAPGNYDEVVIRGDLAGREFIAFWLSGGRVLAGMNVNVWDVIDSIKVLIAREGPIDIARLADVNVPLDDV